MELIQVGIVGCGEAATRFHLPALLTLPGVSVRAAADVDAERLTTVANSFRIPRRYTDWRALVHDGAVDAVAVCVPPEWHATVASAAIAAGKHVFIEKPLALDLDEIDDLIARAARSDRKIVVGHNLRYHRHAHRARALIQQGLLGRVQFIRTAWSGPWPDTGARADWRRRRESGGGVLMDLAVHHFDLCRFLTGDEIEDVSATSRSTKDDDVTAAVSTRTTTGLVTSAVFSNSAAAFNETDVFGSEGRLRLSFYRRHGIQFTSGATHPGLGRRWHRLGITLGQLSQTLAPTRAGGEWHRSYRAQWQHFVGATRGNWLVGCTLEDGKRAVQAALASVASSRAGRSVRPGEAPRRLASAGVEAPV